MHLLNLEDIIDEGSKSKLNDRLFILKMHLFVYNQLGADVCQDMTVYSWQKAGYSIEKKLQNLTI